MSALVAASAAAAAGLASSLHCAAMCGPLAAVAGRTPRAAAAYHGARLASYALAGALAGATGTLLSDALGGRWAGALLSWTLALALALTAWRLWRGEAGPRERLVSLGRRPSRTARLFAALPRHPAALGALTALLPCGALYAGLLVAAGSGSPHGGALSMLAFGVSSALGLGAVSVAATRIARGPRWLPRVLAAALAAGAVLFVVRPLDGLAGDAPPTHCHAGAAQAPR